MKKVYITKAYKPPSSIHVKLLSVEEAPEDPSLDVLFSWLQSRLHRAPEPFDYFYVGQQFYEAQMIEHACTLLQEYVAGTGVESIGWHLLAHCFFRLGEIESAEYCFKKSCSSGSYDSDWQYLVECRLTLLDQTAKQTPFQVETDESKKASLYMPETAELLEKEHHRLKDTDESAPEMYTHHTSDGSVYTVHQTTGTDGQIHSWTSAIRDHRAKIGRPTFHQWTEPKEEARRYVPQQARVQINAYSFPQECVLPANSEHGSQPAFPLRMSKQYLKGGYTYVPGVSSVDEATLKEAWVTSTTY